MMTVTLKLTEKQVEMIMLAMHNFVYEAHENYACDPEIDRKYLNNLDALHSKMIRALNKSD
jgi:hypothetical protein